MTSLNEVHIQTKTFCYLISKQKQKTLTFPTLAQTTFEYSINQQSKQRCYEII